MVETAFFRFTVSGADGNCELLDKAANVTWRPPANHIRFGEVALEVYGKTRRVDLAACGIASSGNEFALSFHPYRSDPTTGLRVWARPLTDQKTLEISYQEDREISVDSIALLGDMMGATDAGKGYVVVPAREGLLVPADSGRTFTHRFETYAYEGCDMEMLGVVENGAAALLTWRDPYVSAELRSVASPPASPARGQRLTPSLVFDGSAGSFRIHVLGKGDYASVATAYRQVAQDEGWRVIWAEKLAAETNRAKLFGAANIKLWSALDRRMNEESTREESVRVNWPFDEAAQVAEHLKRDLKLDKVLFGLGGWIHRGYDNQHPDILPAASECGGDDALSDCARRVEALGYLFCLHDNYQDIYRDSPSWDERLVMKKLGGALVRGGRWAGGRAYLTCSQMALDLARRPQNLPAVRKLTDANAYFIDTTYAAGLQECYDAAHPLTRREDMKWKQDLSDYARGVFGIFGSEDGREWAIPHSDFFEGLTGVSGRSFHDAYFLDALGGVPVPIFELVYHDCIAAYGKYGYDPKQAAEYVLQHISLARPLNYHAIPPHLYWKQSTGQENGPAPSKEKDPALFTRAENGWAAELCPLDRFIKNTCEVLSPLNELTAQLPMTEHHFLTPDRKVQQTVFGQGADAVETVINTGTNAFACTARNGDKVLLPPYGFVVESPSFVAFHAVNWGGLDYAQPALFTLRSLDGKPLRESRRVRVYHAFGDERIRWGDVTQSVRREEIVGP